MPGLVLPAPAKINLVLEILGRRDDGFHALETVFQTLELADEVAVEVRPGAGIDLAVEGADLPAGPDNLAWRAAAAYLGRRPLGRVAIHLCKRVPHGAGLGGGSSDAAAVLRALARLDPDPPAPAMLADLALGLGSDVPFFLVGGTAHALGRGEALTPLADAPAQAVTILKPPQGCPTPAVFRALTDAERGPRDARGAAAWAADLAGRGPAGILANRMTSAAVRVEPAVGALLGWLAHQGVPHLLSGSGSACLALGRIDPPAGVTAHHTAFRPRARLDAGD